MEIYPFIVDVPIIVDVPLRKSLFEGETNSKFHISHNPVPR